MAHTARVAAQADKAACGRAMHRDGAAAWRYLLQDYTSKGQPVVLLSRELHFIAGCKQALLKACEEVLMYAMAVQLPDRKIACAHDDCALVKQSFQQAFQGNHSIWVPNLRTRQH